MTVPDMSDYGTACVQCVNGTLLVNGTGLIGTSDAYVNTTDHPANPAHHGPRATAMLFIFGCCALGAFVRTICKRVPIPYTVILLMLGALLGLLSSRVPAVAEYTSISSMDPHILLHVFMPVLIFESAFAIEVHAFFHASVQIMLLAIPGFGLSVLMTAGFTKLVFRYNWSWFTAVMFGSVVSATDPVAVVALMKDLGASKTLGLVIEGESLFNDGAAMVLFNVFKQLSTPGATMSGAAIVFYFCRVTLGGPLFGYVMGKLTVLWLVNIFNDGLTEITITLSFTYLTFYIGEEFLQVSGVLAVVALGLTLSAERTSISPEVEVFLHRFWQMVAYLANTLIFLLVGVVITEKAVQGVDGMDWALMGLLYVGINFIRAVMILFLSPLLSCTGYGMTWQNATVITWGGIRGAVALALALIVNQDDALDPTGVLQSKVLLHTSGIVMLTLVLNATTMKKLLQKLGMSDISDGKRQSMASALRALQEVGKNCLNSYKSDRFLADADWSDVEQRIRIEDPYHTIDGEADLDDLTGMQDKCSTCPGCDERVLPKPTKKEMESMRDIGRLRLLKAQKTSYAKQFEHGMLSRAAIRKLMDCVGSALDTADKFLDVGELRKTWQVKKVYLSMKRRLENWRPGTQESDKNPVPENPLLKKMYQIANHKAFDMVISALVCVNIILIVVEFVQEAELRCGGPQKLAFDIVNYIFISIYVFEAAWKMLAFRKFYFYSKWNIFDMLILTLSFVDIILDETALRIDEETCQDKGPVMVFNPNMLKVAKVAKMIKLLRVLRSFKVAKDLIPSCLKVIDGHINKALRFGYDVGKGYVMGEEEVQNLIPLMVDNPVIRDELLENVRKGRHEIMKELGQLQKEHPGIAVSVKTQQATRHILNHMRDKTNKLRGEGVIEEDDSEKIDLIVEKKMKELMKMDSSMPPPPPEIVLRNVRWIHGDKDLTEYIRDCAELVSLTDGEALFSEEHLEGGLYIIVSGVVKVNVGPIEITETTDGTTNPAVDAADDVVDYLSTGSVLGEIALLTHQPRRANVLCETSTQFYHVSHEAITSALELFTEEPSLEDRLWKVCALRLSILILKRQINYRSWPVDRIKLHLAKGQVYVHRYDSYAHTLGRWTGPLDTFDYNSLMMSDVILIHGCAEDTYNHKRYVGPCYIPQMVHSLVMSHAKATEMDKHVFLLIPRVSSTTLNPVTNTVAGTTTSGAISVVSMAPAPDAKKSLCLQHSSILIQKLTQEVSQSKLSLAASGKEPSRISFGNRRKRKQVGAAEGPGMAAQKPHASMFGGLGQGARKKKLGLKPTSSLTDYKTIKETSNEDLDEEVSLQPLPASVVNWHNARFGDDRQDQKQELGQGSLPSLRNCDVANETLIEEEEETVTVEPQPKKIVPIVRYNMFGIQERQERMDDSDLKLMGSLANCEVIDETRNEDLAEKVPAEPMPGKSASVEQDGVFGILDPLKQKKESSPGPIHSQANCDVVDETKIEDLDEKVSPHTRLGKLPPIASSSSRSYSLTGL